MVLEKRWARPLEGASVRPADSRSCFIWGEFVRGSTHKLVESELEDFINPKWDRIQNLLASFDSTWPEKVGTEIGDAGKDAINSVVNNRHNFAHGRPGSLSLGKMKQYFKQIEKLIEVLESTVSSKVVSPTSDKKSDQTLRNSEKK